jgi:ferrochelatase
LETTRLVAEKLQLKEGTYSSSFQSRLGFDAWLKPPTDRTVEKMGQNGMNHLAIVTPAFVSDCLETLEEIGMEADEIFKESGGGEFTVIPCLNDREDWSKTLSRWVDEWAKHPVKQ